MGFCRRRQWHAATTQHPANNWFCSPVAAAATLSAAAASTASPTRWLEPASRPSLASQALVRNDTAVDQDTAATPVFWPTPSWSSVYDPLLCQTLVCRLQATLW